MQDALKPHHFGAAELPRTLARVKNKAFEEELEVRIVVLSYSGAEGREMRAGADGAFVPYLVLESVDPDHALKLIKSITVAPCSDFKRRRYSLRRMLQQRGFEDEIEVLEAGATLRR